MMTVHGRATSSNVQVVMWAIAELGLPHRRLDVGGSFGGTTTPGYLAMNPNAKIPVLEDDRLTLFESGAILRYLAARYGDEGFWPTDPAARARLDQWAEWAKVNVGATLTNQVFWPLVRTAPADRNEATLAEGIAGLHRLMPMADARLAQGPWLGGETLTFADVMLGHLLYRYYTMEFERPDTPNLAAYYARLCARPAYAEHVMVSYESLRVR